MRIINIIIIITFLFTNTAYPSQNISDTLRPNLMTNHEQEAERLKDTAQAILDDTKKPRSGNIEPVAAAYEAARQGKDKDELAYSTIASWIIRTLGEGDIESTISDLKSGKRIFTYSTLPVSPDSQKAFTTTWSEGSTTKIDFFWGKVYIIEKEGWFDVEKEGWFDVVKRARSEVKESNRSFEIPAHILAFLFPTISSLGQLQSLEFEDITEDDIAMLLRSLGDNVSIGEELKLAIKKKLEILQRERPKTIKDIAGYLVFQDEGNYRTTLKPFIGDYIKESLPLGDFDKTKVEPMLGEFWGIFPGLIFSHYKLYDGIDPATAFKKFRDETLRYKDKKGERRFFVQYIPYSPDFNNRPQVYEDRLTKLTFKDRRYTEAYKFNVEGYPWQHFSEEQTIEGVPVTPFNAPKPYGAGHVVLIPRMSENLPQELTPEAIKVALRLISDSDYGQHLKIGFNGWEAWGSVNQLHLQTLFFEDENNKPAKMPVETYAVTAKELSTNNGVRISELVDYPVRGFMFEAAKEGRGALTTAIHGAVSILQNTPLQDDLLGNLPYTPHNLIFTKTEDGMRVFLFPRKKQSKEAQYDIGAAFVELGGVLQVSKPELLGKIKGHGIDKVAEEELRRISLDGADFRVLQTKIKILVAQAVKFHEMYGDFDVAYKIQVTPLTHLSILTATPVLFLDTEVATNPEAFKEALAQLRQNEGNIPVVLLTEKTRDTLQAKLEGIDLTGVQFRTQVDLGLQGLQWDKDERVSDIAGIDNLKCIPLTRPLCETFKDLQKARDQV